MTELAPLDLPSKEANGGNEDHKTEEACADQEESPGHEGAILEGGQEERGSGGVFLFMFEDDQTKDGSDTVS